MVRTFVAAWPSRRATAALAALPRPAVPGVRWLPVGDLHVTLRFLGDVPGDEVEGRLRRTTLPRASAALGPTVAMLGNRVVMAPVAGLDALAAAVAGGTAGLGEGDETTRPFLGHLTLARCRDPAAGRRVCGTPVDIAFDVDDVAVVDSETGPEEVRYTRLADVPTG